ncbi:MFS transporter, partial [Ancrocorticia sp.]|uniref:MFS transporter n=1 Tax=Ancrocorticia sp. TaxID=2593684 RepID=UPI003F9254B6
RLIPAGVLQFADWRVALGVGMCFAFACAVLIAVILPKERRFTPKKLRLGNEVSTMVRQWADPRLASLFLVALIFMGAFVSLYNFLGFRLTDTFGLPDSLAGAIFVLYLFGTVASARSGHAVVARGRGKTMLLGAALVIISLPPMLINNLWVTLIGVGLFTYGFFTVHSVASGWVGALAPLSRGEASGMYLTCYYLGSSVVGYASGHVLHTFGWAGMTVWIGLIVALGCALVGYLAFRESHTRTESHRATAALLETGETPGE